jgi:hypothetical protein
VTLALLSPDVRRLGVIPGATPSLVALAIVGWAAAVGLAVRVRARSIERFMAGDVSAVPRAVLRRGCVRAVETLRSPLSGREALVARYRHFISQRTEAGSFVLVTAQGNLQIDVGTAWLVHSERHDTVQYVEAEAAEALFGASLAESMRYVPVFEQLVADGDEVSVVGFLSADGGTLSGTDDWPLLVWSEGTELDEDMF